MDFSVRRPLFCKAILRVEEGSKIISAKFRFVLVQRTDLHEAEHDATQKRAGQKDNRSACDYA